MSIEQQKLEALELVGEQLARIADALERFNRAAVYSSDGVEYVGVSINTDPDVIGDDSLAVLANAAKGREPKRRKR